MKNRSTNTGKLFAYPGIAETKGLNPRKFYSSAEAVEAWREDPMLPLKTLRPDKNLHVTSPQIPFDTYATQDMFN